MRDFPHLAAFLRAVRAGSTAESPQSGPQYPGSRALRDVVTEIVEDARVQGALSPDTGAAGAVDAICALTRGLTEPAAKMAPGDYEATLDSAKRMIRGSLFARHQQ